MEGPRETIWTSMSPEDVLAILIEDSRHQVLNDPEAQPDVILAFDNAPSASVAPRIAMMPIRHTGGLLTNRTCGVQPSRRNHRGTRTSLSLSRSSSGGPKRSV